MTRTLVRILLICALCTLFAVVVAQAAAQHRRRIVVPKEIIQQLLTTDKDIKELVESEHYTATTLAKELRARTIELNNDKRQELVVQGFCSVTGNCSTWIYHKSKKGYQLILDSKEAQVVETRRTLTNGYRDIVLAVTGGAFDSDLALYKFDGKQYQLKECFERHYNNYNDKRRRLHVSQRPRITTVKCQPEQ